jgi:hypothetical protein
MRGGEQLMTIAEVILILVDKLLEAERKNKKTDDSLKD